MKSLVDFIDDSVRRSQNPVSGDIVAFELDPDTLVECRVVEHGDDFVILEATGSAMPLLESHTILAEDFESIRAGLERDCERWYPEAWDRAHQMKTSMDIETALDSVAEDFQDWEEMGTSDRHEACRRVFGYLGINPRAEEGGLEVEPTAEASCGMTERIARYGAVGSSTGKGYTMGESRQLDSELTLILGRAGLAENANSNDPLLAKAIDDAAVPAMEAQGPNISSLQDLVGREFYVKSAGRRGVVDRISPEHTGGVYVQFDNGDMDIVHFTDLATDDPSFMRKMMDRLKSPVADRPIKVREQGVSEGSNSLPSYLRGESRFVKSAYKTLIKYGFIPDNEDERTSQMGSFKHAKGHMADITWEGNIKLLIKQPNGKYMRLYLDDATEMPKVAAQLQLSPVSTEQGVSEGELDEMFYFDVKPGKDRGPRDHGQDELERRARLPKHPLAGHIGQEYKQKDRYGDMYKIAGPKGALPEGEEDDDLEGDAWEMGYRAATLHHRSKNSNPFTGKDVYREMEWEAGWKHGAEEESLEEAEYQGRDVPLGKPMRGDVKKFKVYVKDPKTGNVKKVNFGHGGTSAKRAGQETMRIKKSDPDRRRSFRARHNCDTAKDRTSARYWSCRMW